tara:strand:+ start:363 stop:584 length:222 start_codon:yes stop_codon:yes gene_type:complete
MRGKRRKDKDLWSGKWLEIHKVEIHPDDDFSMIVEDDRHFNLREFDELKMHPNDVRMIAKLAKLNALKAKEKA